MVDENEFGGLDADIDLERPNAARVYDYWLGGGANLAVDRELGDEMIAIDPTVVQMARSNRAFLRRVVRYCVQQGIRQFLDLGSGIPTAGNVHEVAQQMDPSCRVAYVDVEGIAVAHSRRLLRDNPLATITQADVRDVSAVLSAPTVAELLDFNQPVCLLALLVLSYFPDDPDDPAGVIARYAQRLAPNSVIAISHVTGERRESTMNRLVEATKVAATPVHLRSHAQVGELLGSAALVEPGIVMTDEWRPDDPYRSDQSSAGGICAAVGRILG